MLTTHLLSAIVQLGVFIFIPYITHIFRRDRSETFLHYVGIYPAPSKAYLFATGSALLFLVAAVGLAFFNRDVLHMLQSPGNLIGSLHSETFTFEIVCAILIIAWIKTALSEEIFFRGFLGRRLIKRFGLPTGNLVQAIVFSMTHVFLFYIVVGAMVWPVVVVFVFYFIAGLMIGRVNHRYGKGSILPGWVSHGVGNTAAFLIIDFMLT